MARLGQATEKLQETLGVHCLQHSRLYVDVDVGAARVARTREVEFHPTTPAWNQSFRLHCAYPAAAVTFTVKNQHLVGAGVLGAGSVPAARVASGQPVECWLGLRGGEHAHETHYWRAQVNRRGPIYVHAKLMIGTRSLSSDSLALSSSPES